MYYADFDLTQNLNFWLCFADQFSIESCENDSVVNFKKQSEQSEIPAGNGLQSIKLNLTKPANVKVLKIEVLEGYEDFFSIHNLTIL